MTDAPNTEVISAFVDDEPFDADVLSRALAEPAGRELLIDLIALRHVVNGNDLVPAAGATREARWRPWLVASVAATALLAFASAGYVIGERRTSNAKDSVEAVTAPADAAPAPTRVIELKASVDRDEMSGGR